MGAYTPNFVGPSGSSQSLDPLGQSSGSSSMTLPYSSTPPGGGSYTGGQTPTSFAAFPGQNKIRAVPFLDPTFTNQLLSMLGGQIGKGLPAFNQSVSLPSGGQTQPGQLSAPLNPVLQQLQSFMTGKGGPEDLPGVLPMWQSEMEAMQGPIEQNLANLREQFGARGALGSSEMGGAVMDYMSQTSADEMALLTSATQASLPQMLSTGMGIQGIDQNAIASAYNQFQTDLPQNNPLLPYQMALGTMQPGTYQKSASFWQNFTNALMGNAGGIASTGGSALSSAFPNMPGWASILAGA